jgi:hypothetical protein
LAKSQKGATSANKASSTSPLETEAREKWLGVWNSRLRQCGPSYYRYAGEYLVGSKLVMEFYGGVIHEVEPQDYLQLTEARGVSYGPVRVKTLPLSAADRLNHVEWRGTISGGPTFSAERVRERKMGVWQPWGAWRDVDHRSVAEPGELKRTAGEWTWSSGKDQFGNQKWISIAEMARPQPACELLPIRE